jgi:hypothetical protein
MSQAPEPFAFTQNQRDEVRILGDKAGTLSSSTGTHQTTYVAEPVIVLDRAAFNQGVNAKYEPFIGEVTACPTLVSKGPHAVLVPIAFSMREDATNDTFHVKEVEVAHCIQALRPAVTSHHAQNLIVQPTAYILDSFTSNSMLSDNPNSGCREVDKTKCLDTSCLNPTANQGGVMVVQNLYENHPNDSRVTGPHEVAPTVVSRYGTGGGNVPLVAAIPIQDGRAMEKSQSGMGVGQAGDPAYTLDTTGAQGVFQVQAFYSNESQAHLCPPGICPPIKVGSGGTCGSPPAVLVQEPLAVDTFNQTLSEKNQTIRAGTDVDRMGGVLVPIIQEGQVMPTLTAKMQGQTGWAPYNETAHLVPHIVQASELRLRGQITEQETCPTLLANSKQGDNTPLMVAPIVAPTVTTCKGSKGGSSSEAIDEIIAIHEAMKPISFQPGNLCRQAGAAPSEELFPTVKCDTGDQSLHVAHPVACFKCGNSADAHSIGYSEQAAPTLTSHGGGNTIPGLLAPQGVDLYNQTMTGDLHVPLRTAQGHGAPAAIAPTITASNDPSRSPQSSEVTQQVSAVHKVTMAVRRLTPRECERLQGFPDDWSKIPWKGKPVEECPDGPRYKACGNSMAVPVMRWIGERIDAMHKQLYGPKQ